MPASAAQHKPLKAQPYGHDWANDAAWEFCILDPEADEILLELLAHDSSDTHAGWEEREWIRERKRNPVPWLVFLDDKRREKAEREAKAAEREARKAELRAEQRRKYAQWEAERKREQKDLYASFNQRYRDEWIDTLQAMGAHLAKTPHYRHMLAWVAHDIALLRDYPPGPLPWRFHRQTFVNTWTERMKEADDADAANR